MAFIYLGASDKAIKLSFFLILITFFLILITLITFFRNWSNKLHSISGSKKIASHCFYAVSFV